MTSKHIRLSVGDHMRAGRVMFKVVARDDRNHELQLLRLHRGYTAREAQADFGKAFSGNVAAVRRIDANITFLGGAPAKVGKPGWFSVKLHANRYMVVDQQGSGATVLTVRGTAPARPAVPHDSRITALSYGFDPSLKTMPASGWTLVGNHSDQPHFVVMNRVKQGTTRKQVRHYFRVRLAQGAVMGVALQHLHRRDLAVPDRDVPLRPARRQVPDHVLLAG